MCIEDVGIRIQGGGSRGFTSKSINIYARTEYGGNTKIHYDFWSTGYVPDKITLSSCGDDQYSKIRDRIVAELSSSMNLEFATMHFEPYVLFLNGEYWGFYYITEKYDEEYISNYYKVDSSNVVIVKAGAIEAGENEDLAVYQRMIHFLQTADLAKEDNYEIACDLIDMQSTIDYLATEIYVGRCNDWSPGGANTALWRARETGNSKYEDGRWRWMLFDQNSGGLSANLIGFDSIENTRNISRMFNNLCNNETFRTALAEKIIELAKGSFSASNVDAVISGYVEQLEGPMSVHMKRFFGTNEKFYEEVASVRDFFENRYEEMIGFLKKNFEDLDIDKYVNG